MPAAGSCPGTRGSSSILSDARSATDCEKVPAELLPGRAQVRHGEVPRRERGTDARELVAEPPLRLADGDAHAVGGRDDVGAEPPLLPRLQRDGVANAAPVHLARLGEEHLRETLGPVHEDELVSLGVELAERELRERRRAVRVPEREVVLLDREDVSEVGPDLERELELDGMRCVVLDDDVLLHAVADEPVPPDREHVLLEAARDRVAEVERCREVLDLVGGEPERSLAVDREDPAREEARVVGEEAHHGVGDISALVRDAERRPLENREAATIRRTMASWLACCRGLITISSTTM